MIEDMFARRIRNSIGRMKSPRQDLSFEQLKIYYQEAGLSLNDKFAANLELLTEKGAYNYAAYLLADQNGNSVQVAKYAGSDRIDLLDSKEYGFCCLVKTCKSILDRLEGENRVINKITPGKRISPSIGIQLHCVRLSSMPLSTMTTVPSWFRNSRFSPTDWRLHRREPSILGRNRRISLRDTLFRVIKP